MEKIGEIGLDSLKKASQFLKINPVKMLAPEKVIILSVEKYKGYRVQWSRKLGPGKGGIRFHPNLNLKEVMDLSFLMTIKTACTGLPLGGAKGGINCDPKKMKKEELERVTRIFTKKLRQHIGAEIDVLAPDMNTNSEIMGWIADEYGDFRVVTGKDIKNKGSQGRTEATARGIVNVMNSYLGELKNKTVVIQGFGNVGFYTAKILFEEMGCKIIGVSDSKGATFTKNGSLNPEELRLWKNKTGSVTGFKESIDKEEMLKLNCDILIPTAMENLITAPIAEEIKTRIIFEGANGAITLEAEKFLNKKNIFVVPDVIANSGGVIVSYFEMLQNKSETYWSLEKVRKKLEERITNSFSDIEKIAKKHNTTLRVGAYIKALKTIYNLS